MSPKLGSQYVDMSHFPRAGGEMAELIRRRDWSTTPLGPVESWSTELRVTVDNALSNPFPVGVAWGPDLNQIYNDAYSTLLADKHPHVLGRPTREIWAEVWEDVRPLCERVVATGEAVWQEDARFLLRREEGLRECFFTFSYSALYGGDGEVAGIQVTAAETSTSVLNRRRLAAMQAIGQKVIEGDDPVEISRRAGRAVLNYNDDIPFGLVYLGEEKGSRASLVEAFGIDPSGVPESLSLDRAPFGLAEVDVDGTVVEPGEGSRALLLPLQLSGDGSARTIGYLLFGLSPVLPLDRSYRNFLQEVARILTTAYATLLSRVEREELIQRRIQQRYLQERAHLLESIDEPFYALDKDYRITYANNAAQGDPAWPGEDVIGRVLWEVFPAVEETKIPEVYATALVTGESQIVETVCGAKGRHYLVRVFPWQQGLSVAFRDITTQKEFESTLVAAREQAEEMTRVKSSILANMSHEVRTPLTSIIGMATVLSRKVPVQLRDQASHIVRAGKRLANTLESVLTLAQLDGSEGNARPLEPIDLAIEVREAVDLLKPLAREKNLSLEHLAEGGPVVVMADSVYLHSILTNLIGNAIKFTSKGYVLLRTGSDGRRGLLEVTDTGSGIDGESLPFIFEAFRQGSTGPSRTHGGVGLGLNITWKMVRALGGTITVLTTPGVATTFTVTFPMVSTK